MTFYTGLCFYRPRTPPTVTASALSQFIALLLDTNTLRDEGDHYANIKFGDSIDQDDRETSWVEETKLGIGVERDIEWDLHVRSGDGLADLINAIADDDRNIYRAYADLGYLEDEVLQPITRINSPDNEVDFRPEALTVEIGPVMSFDLSSERPVQVGWISINISGYGHLYPWTFQEVVKRIDGSSAIGCLVDVCREYWPVEPKAPEPKIVGVRKEIGDLWPYAAIDKPWGWYWGIQES